MGHRNLIPVYVNRTERGFQPAPLEQALDAIVGDAVMAVDAGCSTRYVVLAAARQVMVQLIRSMAYVSTSDIEAAIATLTDALDPPDPSPLADIANALRGAEQSIEEAVGAVRRGEALPAGTPSGLADAARMIAAHEDAAEGFVQRQATDKVDPVPEREAR